MKYIILSLQLLLFCSSSFGQETKSEEFSSKFTLNEKGGKIVFCGNNKQFVVQLFGKKVFVPEIENPTNVPNQYFITVDKKIIQSTIIAIPKNVQDAFDLKKLTLNQQESILGGYVNYELDYIKKELESNIDEIVMKPEVINSRKYILWHYKMSNYTESDDKDGYIPKGQIYLSTICFDKVLTVNIPVLKEYQMDDLIQILNQIGENIKMSETSCLK